MKRAVLCLTLMLMSVCTPVWGASIVIGTIGTAANTFPFGGAANLAWSGTRYQQAYASADFSGPMSIVGIDFFLKGNGTLASGAYTLSFSVITAGIDTLSTTNFAANIGTNNTVFATGTLNGAAPGTLSFAGAPFLYNPAGGNLLLDIIASPGGVQAGSAATPALFYAQNGSATGIFSRYQDFGSASIGYGLVTQFDFNPAPAPVAEPLSWTLAGVGLALVMLRRKKVSPLAPATLGS